MTKLRVLLVDDHAVLRSGLKLIINAQADMAVVGEAGGGREAIRQFQACQPDIVLMDISMPDLDGEAATAQLKWTYPLVRVLALTRHGDQGYLRRLLQAGASGYILKKTPIQELLKAIRIVANGGTYVDPSLAAALVDSSVGRATTTGADRPADALTTREEEVLRLVAWGRSNQEIGILLNISVKTVEYHKANAVAKLGLHSRTAILRYALAHGWLHDDEGPDSRG